MHEANWRGDPLSDNIRGRLTSVYERALSSIDVQIGRLFAFLRDNDRYSDTIVVFVSDHGEEFLEHGRWGHWEDNLFDEILRVPLIMWLSGSKVKNVVEQQVRLLDLMPTILDLCACEPLANMEGESLTQTCQSESTERRPTYAISEMVRESWHRVSIREGEFKLIWDGREPGLPKLYDLRNGANEQVDVRTKFPEQVTNLETVLNAHLLRLASENPAKPNRKIEVDDETGRRLRDLGYIE